MRKLRKGDLVKVFSVINPYGYTKNEREEYFLVLDPEEILVRQNYHQLCGKNIPVIKSPIVLKDTHVARFFRRQS